MTMTMIRDQPGSIKNYVLDEPKGTERGIGATERARGGKLA